MKQDYQDEDDDATIAMPTFNLSTINTLAHSAPLVSVGGMRSSPRSLLWLALLTFTSTSAVLAADRPNILWITCEDTSPLLGCYGDDYAVTPNLDALAQQGVRYLNAFAYTGVCAPSRSCLITGVYPVRLGSHHMRSTTRLPAAVKCFTEHLREAGYYCSNNSKQDYNFRTPKTAWDESSRKAHWRKRRPGQPFFSVFNFTICHQSQIFVPDEKAAAKGEPPPPTIHDQAKVQVPPIHPATPEFRREWARHNDNVTTMDQQAGEILQQLEKDGLADGPQPVRRLGAYRAARCGVPRRTKGTAAPLLLWRQGSPGRMLRYGALRSRRPVSLPAQLPAAPDLGSVYELPLPPCQHAALAGVARSREAHGRASALL